MLGAGGSALALIILREVEILVGTPRPCIIDKCVGLALL